VTDITTCPALRGRERARKREPEREQERAREREIYRERESALERERERERERRYRRGEAHMLLLVARRPVENVTTGYEPLIAR